MKRLALLLLLIPKLFFAQNQAVDFKTITATINIEPLKKQVSGHVAYTFEVNKTLDSVWLNAYAMKISNLNVDAIVTPFTNNEKSISIKQKFEPGKTYHLALDYTVSPKKSLYFVGWESQGRKQVWTQGQGKDNSHWLPMYDTQTDKALFDMRIAFDKNYIVISNGLLQETKMLDDATKQWHYQMKKPMSTYLLMLAIGKYEKTVAKSASGVLLENYYYPEEQQYVSATYKHSKRIFDFLEKEIGVAFPWEVYRNIPVQDFLYGGMENTSSTIYNESYMIDEIAYNDHNFINVNAHELAHQWFGDYITASKPKHHWLHEGFATYYALLAEKEIFGNAYFEAKIYKNANNIKQASQHDTVPILNGKASSLSFYQKGAWVLYNLNREIGKENFDKAIQIYLKKHALNIVETKDFITVINDVTQQNKQSFFDKWLKTSQIPNDNLANTPYNKTRAYVHSLANNYAKSKALFIKYSSDNSIHVSIKNALLQNMILLKPNLDNAIIKLVLQGNNPYLHKTWLLSLDDIPKKYIKDIENLLAEKSYPVQEYALSLLWNTMPDNNKYLDKMKNTYGFSDYNIRVLWLFLASIDPDYHYEDRQDYLDELTAYTSSAYRASIRQNAFEYLNALQAYSPAFFHNLIDASQHFNWRVSSPARKMLKQITVNPKQLEWLNSYKQMLTTKDLEFLKRFLK
jgi:aminopeptidase N